MEKIRFEVAKLIRITPYNKNITTTDSKESGSLMTVLEPTGSRL